MQTKWRKPSKTEYKRDTRRRGHLWKDEDQVIMGGAGAELEIKEHK